MEQWTTDLVVSLVFLTGKTAVSIVGLGRHRRTWREVDRPVVDPYLQAAAEVPE
jgi:hypothetical protein